MRHYIYRIGGSGDTFKNNVKIDGNYIRERATNIFFQEVDTGNPKYTISTESEFLPKEKNYFIK